MPTHKPTQVRNLAHEDRSFVCLGGSSALPTVNAPELRVHTSRVLRQLHEQLQAGVDELPPLPACAEIVKIKDDHPRPRSVDDISIAPYGAGFCVARESLCEDSDSCSLRDHLLEAVARVPYAAMAAASIAWARGLDLTEECTDTELPELSRELQALGLKARVHVRAGAKPFRLAIESGFEFLYNEDLKYLFAAMQRYAGATLVDRSALTFTSMPKHSFVTTKIAQTGEV